VLLEETKNAVVTNKYLHQDQLGSVARITNASGTILESMDFAAFGERRNVIDPRLTFNNGGQVSNGTVTLPNNQILTLYATKRGFTGHEMVDGFDIVHMNGRIYDNMIGRFLQADPVVQDPSNTQNFNRYTYVWNNPLAYTDPSGYMSFGQILKMVVAIVISIYLPGCTALFGSLTGGLFASMASGFIAGVVTGGLKGGLIGAFSAGLFYGIGSGFEEIARVSSKATMGFGFQAAKVLAHGMAGGVMSVLQGGKFGHGFASAGFTEATAGGIAKIPGKLAQGVVATIQGGAVSALTGGKFANGAMSGLFSYAFNRLRHQEQQKGPKDLASELEVLSKRRDVHFVYNSVRGMNGDIYAYDVYVTDGTGALIAGGYEGSIMFDPSRANCQGDGVSCPTIAAGSYPYYTKAGPGGWKNYRALYLGTVPTTGTNTSKGALNESHYGTSVATTVYAHPGAATHTTSEGCLTVRNFGTNYSDFISNIPRGSHGNVIVHDND
jgi:RHS repeat-associated protein